MGAKIIDREPRLKLALAALAATRSRATAGPATATERQRRDRRINRYDSTKPAAVLASVQALMNGGSIAEAAGVSGAIYYNGGGGNGADNDFGGPGTPP